MKLKIACDEGPTDHFPVSSTWPMTWIIYFDYELDGVSFIGIPTKWSAIYLVFIVQKRYINLVRDKIKRK